MVSKKELLGVFLILGAIILISVMLGLYCTKIVKFDQSHVGFVLIIFTMLIIGVISLSLNKSDKSCVEKDSSPQAKAAAAAILREQQFQQSSTEVVVAIPSPKDKVDKLQKKCDSPQAKTTAATVLREQQFQQLSTEVVVAIPSPKDKVDKLPKRVIVHRLRQQLQQFLGNNNPNNHLQGE
ncbi:hypothetical protein K6025_02625 [Ehrlichia sp. JZT12]